MRKNSRAFTLIELLVVIAIIGILSAVVLSSLDQARARGRDSRRLQDLKQLQTALELFHSQYGCYPIATSNPSNASTLSNPCPTHQSELFMANCTAHANPGFKTSLKVLVDAGFLSSLPEDPRNITTTNKNYCYNYSRQENSPASSWSCGTITRDKYPYALIFSTEATNFDLLKATAYTVPGIVYDYCLVME